MALESIKHFFQNLGGDRTSRADAETTMSDHEKPFAEESLEDQAADRAAAEHLGGIDPNLPPDRGSDG